MVTGVSLASAETALILLASDSGGFVPASLPVWGTYDRRGALTDAGEGPNADLITAALQPERGFAAFDWARLGLTERVVDHIELVGSLLACAAVHAPDAITWRGSPISYALVSGHVAAGLMELEPEGLPSDAHLDELPDLVFDDLPLSHAIYAPLVGAPLRMRFRFGMTFVGFAALCQALRARGIPWRPPEGAAEHSADDVARYLEEARNRFREDRCIAAALEEYAGDSAEEV